MRRADEDPTQAAEIDDAAQDPTLGSEVGEEPLDDPTQGRILGQPANEDPTSPHGRAPR